MSSHQIRLLILQTLKRCGDHKLPERTLISSVQQLSSEDIASSDVTLDINWLEAKGYIDFTKGELGDAERRWFLTPEGKGHAK